MDVAVGGETREERFTSTGGLSINLRSWLPAGAARAVLVIVHGFNAHGGLYDPFAQAAARRSLATYAPDLRGRGKSDGERFFVASFADYVADVDGAVQLAKSRHPGLPVFLMGHSAGGVVSCTYALDHPAELAGLVCESFAFQVPVPSFAVAALRGLAHVFPHAHVLRLKNEDFSRDPAMVAALNADPLIADEVQPTQTVAEMARADARLAESFGQITLPLLILHGAEDKVTRPEGSKAFYEAAGSRDKTLRLYEGVVHDPLADLGKEEVTEEILSWIEARVPAG